VKKLKKPTSVRFTKAAPSGWPSEKEWKEIERKLSKGLATKVLPKDAGPVEKTKYDLCEHFVIYHQKIGISQREMAARLGVTESRVSEILHYRIERYTIDKLLTLLSKIHPEIRIRVA
jgi:predicted XRE-type DNA-binding protein